MSGRICSVCSNTDRTNTKYLPKGCFAGGNFTCVDCYTENKIDDELEKNN